MPRGGRRAGAGRPKGSRSKVLHRDEKVDEARFHTVEEAELYLKTNGASIFEGDALAFLTAVYKDEALPLHVRFNAALACAPFERPRMSDARALLLEARAKEISEAELKRQQDEGDRRLTALEAAWNRLTNENEAELQGLIESGDITPRGAAWVRSMWRQPERLALPPPSGPEMPNRAEEGRKNVDLPFADERSPPAPRQSPPVREAPPPVQPTPPAETRNRGHYTKVL
jgi:hypothetical protein